MKNMILVKALVLFVLNLLILSLQGSGQTRLTTDRIIIKSDDLFPECAVMDTSTKQLYLSSISRNKIVLMDTNGKVSDFIKSGQYGFQIGLGMKADLKKNVLWAVSSKLNSKKAFVFKFNLLNGQLLKKYRFSADKPIFLNDLTFDQSGNLFITDSENADIYKLNTQTGSAGHFFHSPYLRYPNGITYDTSANSLFIAGDSLGISVLSLSSMKLELLKSSQPTSSAGLDGIYFYHNSIIGVFNGSKDLKAHKVLQFYLNREKDSIMHIDTLPTGELNCPTTGFIMDDRFYFLANTYIPDFVNKTSLKTTMNEMQVIELDTMEQSKKLRRLQIINDLTEAFNLGDLKKVFSFYNDAAVYIDQIEGKQPLELSAHQVMEKYKRFREAFPDLHDRIIKVNFQHNDAFIDAFVTGTNVTTGEKISNPVKLILTFNEDDQIIKDRTIF